MPKDGNSRQFPDWAVWPASWKLLQFFNVYRLSLNLGLWALYTFGSNWLLSSNGNFVTICQFYLATSLIYLIFGFFQRSGSTNQVALQTFLDIFIITLLVHTGGGLQSGFGCLLLLVMINASILMPGRLSFIYPAIATLSLLAEQAYSILNQNIESQNFTQSGMLGMALFATSYATNILAKRLTHSEALRQQQQNELKNWESLNSLIIQNLPAGVVVLDKKNCIRIFNLVAEQLLNLPANVYGKQLAEICPPLEETLKKWQLQSCSATLSPFALSHQGHECMARFTLLGDSDPLGLMIWLEDAARQNQAAHHMKLASLGRLTASIAHEIRNPLSAIRHASQLLTDENDCLQENQRLLQIIQENATRTNTIIENVLSLSSAKPPRPQCFALLPWLNNFSKNLLIRDIKNPLIKLQITPVDLQVAFDPEQLHQILIILCDNGFRYSLTDAKNPYLVIKAHSLNGSHVCLDVIDTGPGVNDSILKHLFEPFCSSEPKGTGLGLFLARSLAEANGGNLSYQRTESDASCFRLQLPIFLFRMKNYDNSFSTDR